MSGRGKLTKSLSTGVIVLVFFLLIIQLAIFGARIFQVYRENKNAIAAAAAKDTAAVATVAENSVVPNEKGASFSANKKVSRSAQPAKTVAASGHEKKSFALAPLPPKPTYKPKPKVDINQADTTELMTLYGIGAYFARRIVEFRGQLGGSYASVEQLMDIKGIDSARFVGFEQRICLDSALIRKIDFYTYPLDSLALHPYIGKYAAKGIDRLRRTVPREEFSIAALVENGIVSAPQAQRLLLYIK